MFNGVNASRSDSLWWWSDHGPVGETAPTDCLCADSIGLSKSLLASYQSLFIDGASFPKVKGMRPSNSALSPGGSRSTSSMACARNCHQAGLPQQAPPLLVPPLDG